MAIFTDTLEELNKKMEKNLVYKSTGKNLFNTWRIFLIFTPISILVLYFIGLSFLISLSIALLANITIALVSVYLKVSEIKREGEKISFVDREKNLFLENIQKVETWWSYDFGSDNNEINSSPINGSKAHSNVMNIFAEITTNEGVAYIYEQIYMSSKYPHDHTYRHDKIAAQDRLYKVWDVDKCIEKLELNNFKISSKQ